MSTYCFFNNFKILLSTAYQIVLNEIQSQIMNVDIEETATSEVLF